MVVNETSNQVWVHLAASKTDPQAFFVWRYWGCLCRAGSSSADSGTSYIQACPYHAALEQATLVRALALRLNLAPSELPFFPTSSGKSVAKARVVERFEHVARTLGEPLRDDRGRRRFTGHLLRVLGARMLAAAGIELFKIQLLARWEVTYNYAARRGGAASGGYLGLPT